VTGKDAAGAVDMLSAPLCMKDNTTVWKASFAARQVGCAG
jgi:hypothetical protein